MTLALTGSSGLSGLNFIPFLNPVTIEFDTTATTGQTFRPIFTRAVGNAPLQWTFPDANNTLGVATFSGNLLPGFTFTTAGTKTVSVSAPDWDSFVALDCSNCRLTGLRFISSEIGKTLTLLYCNSNQLTSLTLPTSMPALQQLQCHSNSLTSLTLPTSMPALTFLHCFSNQLTSLTLPTSMPALQQLQCNSNQLTALTLPTSMPALTQLHCNSNQLTSLTLPASMPALTQLYCNNNFLTSLTLPTSMPALQQLRCNSNQLSSGQISAVFDVAVASFKKIATLIVSANPGSTAGTSQQTILQTAPYAWTITR